MDVKEIVSKWLKAHGYDGLYAPYGCACPIDDLMCCDERPSDCLPGYHMLTEDGEEGIGPVRDAGRATA